MNKFCEICGKENIKYQIEGFNSETGERNFKMGCPTCILCKPGKHRYDVVGYDSQVKCVKCGMIYG